MTERSGAQISKRAFTQSVMILLLIVPEFCLQRNISSQPAISLVYFRSGIIRISSRVSGRDRF